MISPIQAAGVSAESLVRDVIDRWREGDRPDAASVLSANPDVRERKSLAMDLIYEEYCLRHESGESLAASTFCQKFPTYRQSLQRMLDVHQFMDVEAEAAEDTWKWPQPGETVLGFKLVEQLGAGAIARVYLAQQPELGERHVVVKISRDGASEAKLLGKLEHPSIVPIHSVHQDASSGLTCICMPFLGTATLTDLLDLAFSKAKPPQSAEIVLAVARQYRPVGIRDGDESAAAILRAGTYCEGIVHLGVQLAEALAAAHEAGVMHRDIKPSNVLLSRSGRPMLLDFNLSSDLEMPLQRVGGTVAYMAPERIRTLMADEVRSESKLDPRSDVYSLGALLYELLCGELPSRPNLAAGKQPRLEDWLKCRLTPPAGLCKADAGIDARMEQVVLRALHPDPAERFSSAAEFARSLQECLAWKTRTLRWAGRNRRQVLAGGIAVLAAAVIAGAVWVSGEPYEQRLFTAGRQAYEKGDSKSAIESFSQVLVLRPDDVSALFARGQAHRQGKDFVLAQRDFQAAYDKSGNAELLAYVGYCEMKEGHCIAARGNYEKAIQNGFSSPQLLHNIAYCLSKVGEPKEAAIRLEGLLRSEPKLFLSHHLCARLQLDSVRSAREPLPDYVRKHMEIALDGIRNEPLLYIDAARVLTYADRMTPSQEDQAKALEHLHQAVAAGVSKLPITTDSLLSKKLPLLSPEDQALLDRAPPTLLSTPLYFEPSSNLSLPVPSVRIAAR